MTNLHHGCTDYNQLSANPLTMTRRYFLGKSAKGLGGLALGSLLSDRLIAEPRPTGRIDVRHFRRVLGRLNLLQLDSVNVAVRAHYMPMFTRPGPYDRSALDAWINGPEAFEYWGHEASVLPIGDLPLASVEMERRVEQGPQLRHGRLVLLGLSLVQGQGPHRDATLPAEGRGVQCPVPRGDGGGVAEHDNVLDHLPEGHLGPVHEQRPA